MPSLATAWRTAAFSRFTGRDEIMSKKKLLVLANHSGGVYNFRGELLKALTEEYEVSVSSPDNGHARLIEELGCRFIPTDIDRRGINPMKDMGLILRYMRLLRRERPDIVVTYTIKPNIYGGILCRIKHIPYVVNITGLGTTFQGDGLLRRAVTKLYKAALGGVKAVLFENKENRRIFVDEGIVDAEKTCVLSGAGVDLEKFSLLPYPEERSGLHLLFMGRVMKEKGVDELFNAVERLNAETPCVLNVLGRYEEHYEAAIAAAEAAGWLKYHGFQDDVRPFIRESDCFVLPSWHEGMANTNLESAACGRPVITSNIPGCMEAVSDGVSGYLCEAKNADSLYAALKRFSELPHEDRRRMGLAGRRRMEKLFDKRTVVRQTVEYIMQ